MPALLPPSSPRPVRAGHARDRTQRGFSLLEVLVAIFVLSFGMLGMVGMQSFSLQANRQARMASTAAGLAREMAEMMRGHKNQARLTTNNPYVGTFTSTLTPTTANYCIAVSNATTGCSGGLADIANAQMTEWLRRVDSELPGSKVQICFDTDPYDSNGLPQWGCNGSGTDGVIYIKMAWTQISTNRSDTDSAALIQASTRPILIIPITAGNT